MDRVTTPLTRTPNAGRPRITSRPDAPAPQSRGIPSIEGIRADAAERPAKAPDERRSISSARRRTPARPRTPGGERAGIRTADRYERSMGVPRALRPWFTQAGQIPTLDAAGLPFTHIPDAATRLTLRHEVTGRRDIVIVGPRTRASYNAADEPASCLRLHIAPGAVRPLLGVPAAELTDRLVDLDELPGPLGEFADRLLNSSFTEAMALLEDALPQRISDDPADSSRRALLDAAMSAMAAAPAPIPEIAARLAVSERHLRSLFTTGIGLSPKHFVRIDRIRRLVSEPGSGPLAEIAATAGYYDQSHMTADFRALMGTVPTRFFGGNLPAPTPCQSLLAVRPAA
ncbi:AraC-like DNA-binding protein [Nocardia sp. GAS34]